MTNNSELSGDRRHTELTATTSPVALDVAAGGEPPAPPFVPVYATYRADELTVHPIAADFPRMGSGEQELFGADFQVNGQREPVVITETREVIDGRHRLEMAAKLGLPVLTVTAPPMTDEEIRAFGVSKNVARRQLEKGQLAIFVDDFIALRKRKGELLTVEQACERLGVSVRTRATVRAVRKADPKLYDEVRAGKLTADGAMAKVTAAKRAATPAMPFLAPTKSHLKFENRDTRVCKITNVVSNVPRLEAEFGEMASYADAGKLDLSIGKMLLEVLRNGWLKDGAVERVTRAARELERALEKQLSAESQCAAEATDGNSEMPVTVEVTMIDSLTIKANRDAAAVDDGSSDDAI